MWKKLLKTFRGEEKGITGLETAIILIAFVVIASVFAYTVLSAGIFSSQKGQEAVYAGLAEARSTMELKGSVVAMGNSTSITSLNFVVSSALDGEAIDLTAPTDGNSDGVADSGSSNVTVMSYHSETVATQDLAYTATRIGWGDSDSLLESGEKFEIVVDFTGVGENVGTYKTFTLEIKPPRGSVLNIERTTPASLDSVMILN
ncbi:MAG: archaellin/type IV pilin N-terminal domain-containing protein [Dehalococcoidia bacterium]